MTHIDPLQASINLRLGIGPDMSLNYSVAPKSEKREPPRAGTLAAHNVQALARKYGVSEVRIFALIQRQRLLKRRKEKKE
jgi:hypothetical protein